MSLTSISFVPAEQVNLVVQAKSGLLKVASASSGTLGYVQAVGAITDTVNWSITGNPGSAITLAARQDDPTIADITFANVPIRTEPWMLILQASTPSDGVLVQIPLAVLVREAFLIREVSRAAGNFTLTGNTCDPTLAALSFKGYGPGGADADVCFIPPTSLPTGLTFSVDEDDTAYLTPAPITLSDPTGGIKGTSGVSYSITLKAYREGTLYDSPDDPAKVTVTYDLTAGAKVGTLAFGVGGSYDSASTKGVLLEAILAYKGGRVPVSSYTTEWSVSAGAQGSWSPTVLCSQAASAAWIPSAGVGAQDVTFTVVVKEDGTTVSTANIGPFPITDAADWTATDSAPVVLYPAKLYPQESGKKVYFRITCPDLTAAESAAVSFTIAPVGSAPAVADAPTSVTILGTSSTKDAVVGFTIPESASVYDMWTVQVAVAVTGGTGARTGFGQLLAVSSGKSPLVIQVADTTLAGSTGSYLTPVTLKAYRWSQSALPSDPTNAFLNPIASAANSTLVEVTGASFRVSGAPAGLAPVYQTGAGVYQLTGIVPATGTTTFQVVTQATGFQAGSTGSESVTLVAAVGQTRLNFSAFSSTNSQVTATQGFTLSWGTTGTGTVTLQGNNVLPPDDVTGDQSATITSINASTAYILRGANALGESLSSPMLVRLGATGSATQLPASPTIAVINENEHCSVVWQPTAINESYAAYGYWQLSVKDGSTATPYLVTKLSGTSNQITGLESPYGGTTDARQFEFDFSTSGYHEMSMKAFASPSVSGVLDSAAWNTFKAFPAPRVASLNKTTASKGEAITLSIGSANLTQGVVGDRWQAVYSDGTSSEWFPMSITSVAKSFSTGGTSHTIKMVVEANYASAAPAVKLRRSVTLSVFVQDQDYQGTEDTFDITNQGIGLGGEEGFEITNNLGGTTTSQAYLVATQALVRDDTTNELKLMVATSRTRDASSILGTMALDVFPLPGRPHTLDLVSIPGRFLTSDGTLYDPVSITQDALPDVIVGQNLTPVQLQAEGGLTPYRWYSLDLPTGMFLSRDGILSGTAQELGIFNITVSVQDAQEPSSIDETVLTLTAKSDLAIVTPTLTTPVVGTEYSAAISATGGIQPYTWEVAAGSLPGGLSLGIDGVISGWPVTYNSSTDFTDNFTFVAQVTDAIGAIASKQITLQLDPMALTILPPDQDTLVQGLAYKVRFPVVGGEGDYTLVGSPSAPTGLVDSIKIVNGIIEMTTRDAFRSQNEDDAHVGLRVRDSKATEVYAEYTLKIRTEIPVSRWVPASMNTRITSASAAQVLALGGAATGVSYSSLEVLPALANATASVDVATGQVRIAPPVVSGRNQEILLRATLAEGSITLGKVSREYHVPTVLGTNVTSWIVAALPLQQGSLFAFDIQASGLNPPTPSEMVNKTRLAENAVLPTGVSMDESTGVLYGAVRMTTVPASTALEVVNEELEVTSTVTVEWTVVDTAIQLTGTLPEAEVGKAYNGLLSVVGASSTVVASILHGRLPLGMTMESTTNGIEFSGRPMETGYFDLWIQAKDTQNRTGLYTTRLVVDYLPYLAVTSTSIPTIIQGFAYSNQLTATGGKSPYTWELALGSSLPDGVTLSTAGVLSGTATAVQAATATTFVVTDSYGQTAQASLNVEVGTAPTLVITTESLPDGVVGGTYIGAQLQATGGVAPLTWPQVTLPTGLTLDSTTGLISGTPTAVNSTPIPFKVRDALGTEVTKNISLAVLAANAFRILTESLPQGRMDEVYGVTGTATPAFWVGDAGSPRVGGSALSVKFGTKAYVLCVGGLCASRGNTQATGDLQIFDPDVVVNGVRTGQYASLTATVEDLNNPRSNPMGIWNLKDRLFPALAQISTTEFVMIGGARMGGDNAPTYDGDAGRALQDSVASDSTSMAVTCFVKTSLVNNKRVLQFTPGPCPTNGSGTGVGKGRYGMAATMLADGRVFACGGVAVLHATTGSTVSTLMDARISGKETFLMTLGTNRANSSWAQVADMPVALVCAKAVTLKDGRVLVIGGLVRSGTGYTDPDGSTTCLIYTPSTNTWTTGPAFPEKSFTHAMVVLADGRVLCGGSQSGVNPGAIYVLDAAQTAWTQFLAYSSYAPNCGGRMVLLADGTGIWMGGTQGVTWSDLTSNIKGLALLVPDYLNYSSAAELLAADYSGNYPWAAEIGKFGTYFFNTNTQNTIALEATGGIIPYNTWTATSALPTGLTLNAATGTITGTPTVSFDADVTFTANDSTAPAAGGPLTTPVKAVHLTITDKEAPVWVTTALTPGYLEEAYSVQLVAKDGLGNLLSGNFTISPLSQYGLPTGITLDVNGRLYGTTSVGWVKDVIFRVTNPSAPTKYTDKTFTVDFSCNTQIPDQTPQAIVPNVAYSYQIQKTGGKGPYTWAATLQPSLPTGLVLDTTTGLISGTPGPTSDKDVEIPVTVTDPNGCTGGNTLTFQVRNAAFQVLPTAFSAARGSSFSQALTCTGATSPYTWTITGLPSGFTYMSATGVISSTMVSAAKGDYPLTVTIKDATGATYTTTVTLTVTGPAYSWFSGMQVSTELAMPMHEEDINLIPLAYYCSAPGMLFDYRHRGTEEDGWLNGDPWVVVIQGNFKSALPTLTVVDTAGVAWVVDFLSMNTAKTEARFGISIPVTYLKSSTIFRLDDDRALKTSATMTLAATLNDSGTVSTQNYVVTRDCNYATFGWVVSDESGVTGLSEQTYTD